MSSDQQSKTAPAVTPSTQAVATDKPAGPVKPVKREQPVKPVDPQPIDRADRRARLQAQRELFGGIHWGSAFFGWLSANGLAVLMLALVSAGGIAIRLTTTSGDLRVDRVQAEDGMMNTTPTIGLVGGGVVLAILAIAYFAGGYVAGRMSRFDGARQGFAVWVVGLVAVFVLAVAGTLFGAKYNVLARFDLPRIPVDEGTATRGAVVALVAILVVSAIAAVIGGKVGERFHRRIDRVAVTG